MVRVGHWCCEGVVLLYVRDIVEQGNKFLANQVIIIGREVFDDAQDDGICENTCVKQMDGIVG